MSTLSIHPIEHLKLHLHYEEVRTGLLASLGSLVKKVFKLAEQAAIIAVVLLSVGLVIFSFMKIGEFSSVTASYNNAIIEVVHPPLPAMPTGM